MGPVYEKGAILMGPVYEKGVILMGPVCYFSGPVYTENTLNRPCI
jgi:hypothetical protein